MDAVSIIIFCAIALFALALLWIEGLLKYSRFFLTALLCIAAAFVLRALCMNHVTLDYEDFLSVWVDFFRKNGGFAALSRSIGNYNVPYLYFLALFSYSDTSALYLIKLLSILFDVLLAWAAMKLVGTATKSSVRKLFVFLAVLLLPTVILNSAYWGQCDSIYVSLGLIALWLALSDRPALSVVFIALSFSFKLQAVFLMPIYLVFLFSGRIRFRHLFLFPATYVVVVLPAVLAGRPFIDTITLYFDQAGTVGSALNYNSPSAFALLHGNVDEKLFSYIGIGCAFLFCVIVFIALFFRRRSLSNRLLIAAALLFAVGVPFLLPHMHDRYFYAADVLSLSLAVVSPWLFPVPVCVSFASLLGYHAYLRMRYLLPMRYGSFALIIALVLTIVYMSVCVHQRKHSSGR